LSATNAWAAMISIPAWRPKAPIAVAAGWAGMSNIFACAAADGDDQARVSAATLTAVVRFLMAFFIRAPFSAVHFGNRQLVKRPVREKSFARAEK
jgi:hypothetical protein